MDKNKLNALITLLDDPNQEIYKIVENNILKEGKEIINVLENAWESSNNELFQNRIENIIDTIQMDSVYNNLKKWLNNKEKKLLDGIFLLTKTQYTSLKFDLIKSSFYQIKEDFEFIYNESLSPLHKVKLLNHVFFNLHHFEVDVFNENLPHSIFINYIFSNKIGNVISLSLLYAALAQELNIPIYCVDLPTNFIVIYKDEKTYSHNFENQSSKDILFYINILNKGSVSGQQEVDTFIKNHHDLDENTEFLPIKNEEIIFKLLNILISHFQEKKDYNQIEKLSELKKLFN